MCSDGPMWGKSREGEEAEFCLGHIGVMSLGQGYTLGSYWYVHRTEGIGPEGDGERAWNGGIVLDPSFRPG